jgi:hypothetical protein
MKGFADAVIQTVLATRLESSSVGCAVWTSFAACVNSDLHIRALLGTGGVIDFFDRAFADYGVKRNGVLLYAR